MANCKKTPEIIVTVKRKPSPQAIKNSAIYLRALKINS
jgi:hypothetical protein